MRLCPHCFCDIDETDDLPPDTVAAVLAAVGDRLVVEPSRILGPSRDRRVVDARHAAVAVLRNVFGLSYTALGRIFNRDHTTMIHSHRKADQALVAVLTDDLTLFAPERGTDPDNAADGPLRVVS